jgi:hypothetical protein
MIVLVILYGMIAAGLGIAVNHILHRMRHGPLYRFQIRSRGLDLCPMCDGKGYYPGAPRCTVCHGLGAFRYVVNPPPIGKDPETDKE